MLPVVDFRKTLVLKMLVLEIAVVVEAHCVVAEVVALILAKLDWPLLLENLKYVNFKFHSASFA